jgi:hypothetical protein
VYPREELDVMERNEVVVTIHQSITLYIGDPFQNISIEKKKIY